MNYLTIEELIENLSILLDNEDSSADGQEDCLLPNEDEINEILQRCDNTEVACFQLQQPLSVAWNNEDGSRFWCVGMFQGDTEDNCIMVDHLHLSTHGKGNKMSQWACHVHDCTNCAVSADPAVSS